MKDFLKSKGKWLLFVVLPLLALILEMLPYGAVCNFANPEGEPWRKTYSYFALTPFGYANFSPLLTAICTCVALVLGVVVLWKGKWRAAYFSVACLAAALSLCPMLLGIRFYSVVGGFISASLIAAAVYSFFFLKEK